ncbi:UvrD-helicase domain-containing protein [Gammaproteobacteria bacterium]|nr:UvrD-helicase domain-containing protein [Gammaproteobacteria bacterium]
MVETLNPEQQSVVTADNQHRLVLSGAGSGKTRVLVSRYTWLIEQGSIPDDILCVTFTNKAAAEMKERIQQSVSHPIRPTWIGTFHGLSHRFLRKHTNDLRLSETFQILDQNDQSKLIKMLYQQLKIDEKEYPLKSMIHQINAFKSAGKRSNNLDSPTFPDEKIQQQVYQCYEKHCEQNGLLDFAELILKTLETLKHHEALKNHYHQQFRYILVDEFQDTSPLQYDWLKAFCGQNATMMAVGDDDQSIYSWRGANVMNMMTFCQDFPDVAQHRLEQNYRSTKHILSAANGLIKHNTQRHDKTLWTDNTQGERLQIHATYDERDEAKWIIHQMQQLHQKSVSYQQMAILYRSNAQSRIFEEQLNQAQVPYRVHGGLRFFDRAEIKDTLAYLRLLASRQDDISWLRVINTPTRGIGASTIETIKSVAQSEGCCLWQASQSAISQSLLKPRAIQSLQNFITLIESLDHEIQNQSLSTMIQQVLQTSGILTYYRNMKDTLGQQKLENLQELIHAAEHFQTEQTDQAPLVDFLSSVCLDAGDTETQYQQDAAQLMTLHAAKGLEFPVVFLSGLEEGLFPHQMCLNEPGGLEEERRLCYVGITRAKQKLYLTYASNRRLAGQDRYQKPSRFLSEIPQEDIQGYQPPPSTRKQQGSFPIGALVEHAKFGIGTVLAIEGQDKDERVKVRFSAFGSKWLMTQYANLKLAR